MNPRLQFPYPSYMHRHRRQVRTAIASATIAAASSSVATPSRPDDIRFRESDRFGGEVR
eukprot:CAMPEP_0178516480 /NCGR_PEP_ID=MMETSP0696-20121128/25136_1 /TAXON_ID=265572 /ORGANISM="Extubocellulus spinifer, Strain CCMP396" /LENGTH=58 /DNA_ID=CAMNT_0020146759 /DNA_START=95 /DNA_END=267 /DNA_ORIENTATION=-